MSEMSDETEDAIIQELRRDSIPRQPRALNRRRSNQDRTSSGASTSTPVTNEKGTYPEFEPGNPTLHIDDFGLRGLPKVFEGKLKIRGFPPLPNAAYELGNVTSTARFRPSTSPKGKEYGDDYFVLHDYEGQPGDLDLRRGTVITITQKADDGWWLGRSPTGKHQGWVPSNYLEHATDVSKILINRDTYVVSQDISKGPTATVLPAVLDSESSAESDELSKEKMATSKARRLSRGERLAEGIGFFPHPEDVHPAVSGQLYPPAEQREDFIKNIDAGGPDSELEYCKKCDNIHIPPGPPITLADRDTCGAYLPEWFPTDEGPCMKPWDSFRHIINSIVQAEEIKQGYSHKTAKTPQWNLQYHEYDIKWRQVGRREGWWKCREGINATEAERECQLCHVWDGEVEKGPYSSSAEYAQHYIDKWIATAGEVDKGIVIARIRNNGWPQFLGETEERAKRPVGMGFVS